MARPRKYDTETLVAQIAALHGKSYREMAKQLGVSISTICRVKQRMGMPDEYTALRRRLDRAEDREFCFRRALIRCVKYGGNSYSLEAAAEVLRKYGVDIE